MLKLKAKDAEDMQVISAILQDAIVPLCDMAWQPKEKSFVMVVQRLCREAKDQGNLERVCCAVNLRGVESVQTHGIDLNDHKRMLDLLMMITEGPALHFIFADDAEIRIRLDNWLMIIEDFGEAWPAACEPCHDNKQLPDLTQVNKRANFRP
jgi:hypothetical protein